jgi:hypothetical protein
MLGWRDAKVKPIRPAVLEWSSGVNNLAMLGDVGTAVRAGPPLRLLRHLFRGMRFCRCARIRPRRFSETKMVLHALVNHYQNNEGRADPPSRDVLTAAVVWVPSCPPHAKSRYT